MPYQVDHFDGRGCSIETFVARFSSSPIDRLLHSVRSQNAIYYGNVRHQRQLSDSFGGLSRYIIEVRRILVGEADGAIDELDSAGNVIRSEFKIAGSSAISKQIVALSVAGDTLFACTPLNVVLISRSTFNVLDTYSHFVPSQGSIQANAAGHR